MHIRNATVVYSYLLSLLLVPRVKDDCIERTGVHYSRYGWIFTAQPTGYDTILEGFISSKCVLEIEEVGLLGCFGECWSNLFRRYRNTFRCSSLGFQVRDVTHNLEYVLVIKYDFLYNFQHPF